MNNDFPNDPREALEARLTALLLGELSEAEAAEVRVAIAQDPALAKLRARLARTIDLVRDAAATAMEPAAAPVAALKLSDDRRQKLLAHFKTVAPQEFGPRRKREYSWLVPMAAAIAILLIGAFALLPGLSPRRPYGVTPLAGERTALARREEVGRDLQAYSEPVGDKVPSDSSQPPQTGGVYSQNVVGYVNVPIGTNHFQLVANKLQPLESEKSRDAVRPGTDTGLNRDDAGGLGYFYRNSAVSSETPPPPPPAQASSLSLVLPADGKPAENHAVNGDPNTPRTMGEEYRWNALAMEAAAEPLQNKAIQLRYSNPANLEGVLKSTLTDGRSSVQADPLNGRLLVQATDGEMKNLGELVAQLDAKPRQTLIEDEGRLLDSARSRGIDWGADSSGAPGVRPPAGRVNDTLTYPSASDGLLTGGLRNNPPPSDPTTATAANRFQFNVGSTREFGDAALASDPTPSSQQLGGIPGGFRMAYRDSPGIQSGAQAGDGAFGGNNGGGNNGNSARADVPGLGGGGTGGGINPSTGLPAPNFGLTPRGAVGAIDPSTGLPMPAEGASLANQRAFNNSVNRGRIQPSFNGAPSTVNPSGSLSARSATITAPRQNAGGAKDTLDYSLSDSPRGTGDGAGSQGQGQGQSAGQQGTRVGALAGPLPAQTPAPVQPAQPLGFDDAGPFIAQAQGTEGGTPLTSVLPQPQTSFRLMDSGDTRYRRFSADTTIALPGSVPAGDDARLRIAGFQLVENLSRTDSDSLFGRQLTEAESAATARTGLKSYDSFGDPAVTTISGRQAQFGVDLAVTGPGSGAGEAGTQTAAIPLQNTDAATMAELLANVFSRDAQAAGAGGVTRGTGTGGAVTRGTGAGGAGGRVNTPGVTVAPDTAGNRLVIRASSEELAQVSNLLAKLDKPASDASVTESLPLKNADPTEMATMLGLMFPDPGTTTARSGGRAGTGTAAGTPGKVDVFADERTRSLIVNAPPEMLAEAKRVVEELDANEAGVSKVYRLRVDNAVDPQLVMNTLKQVFPARSTTASQTASTPAGTPILANPGRARVTSLASSDTVLGIAGTQRQARAYYVPNGTANFTYDPDTRNLLTVSDGATLGNISSVVAELDKKNGNVDELSGPPVYRERLNQVAEQWIPEKSTEQSKGTVTFQDNAGDEVPPIRKPATNAPIPQAEVQAADNAFSTFSLNVSDVAFKLAAASLEKGQMPDAATVRSEEFINAFDYRDPEPKADMPIGFAWERARYPFAHNRDLLRFSVKTGAAGRQQGRPLNLVLLLDNSGSMERSDRAQIIREALRVLASQLQPQDKISVITFSRTARLWVDGVAGNQAGEVFDQVGSLTPQGGTNLEEAMNLAYATALKHYLANGMNRVVILTDGAANLGNVEPEALKQKVEAHRKQGIALDAFGIGWEGFNDDLLETLTRNGDGRYGFINSPAEAATEFAGQLAGALKVAASDVKVQVEFNPKRVTSYRQIGYAKHQLTKEQFRDNTVDAAELAAQEAGNALYTVEVNPAGSGPIGTVRVRFKVPGTTQYREHAWDVPFNGNAVAMEQASPAMRLAATASAFSEWLVASPYAGEVTPDRLLGYLSGVPEICGADERPKKLEWMIRQARSVVGK